jgi:Phospholipid methyltransferase
MPVVTITGPSGLTKDAKKQLIEGTLHVLTETYQMPDDRAIDTGPYAIVRHPMYLGSIFWLAGLAVALESVPGGPRSWLARAP